MTGAIRYFTANYLNTDSNFAIHNLRSGKVDEADLPFYCVLSNILQRGCPTIPSQFLKSSFENVDLDHKLRLLSKNVPNWKGVIKGGKDNNPAMVFYYQVIPHFFPDIPFLQSLTIPEYPIGSIIDDKENEFVDQKVDFFIPEADLVIEIDGKQHLHPQQMMLDAKRDAEFAKAGIASVRIRTEDIWKGNSGLEDAIKQIRSRLQESRYKESFLRIKSDYERPTESLSEVLKQVSTIRLQITMVQLLLNGTMSRRDNRWRIAVRSREVSGYEQAAIEDILIWLEALYILAGESFVRPKLDLVVTDSLNTVLGDYIKVDVSVLEVGTLLYAKDQDTIYVSASTDQRSDFFRVETSSKIKFFQDSGPTAVSGVVLDEQRRALLFFLKNLFGFPSFNSGQERIIINALKCRDTIGVLPTGSGKSLCYQMCMLLQPSIHICVSPIKALMVDQSQNLNSFGITRNTFISSDLTAEERSRIQKRFSSGRFILTLISPERFQSEEFREFIQDMVIHRGISFGYAVIDEVHCMSEWGHSFRVSYLNLVKTIRKLCGNVTLFGLTATASLNVLKNIKIEFGMDLDNNDDVISVPYFTRENLRFSVRKQADNDDKGKYGQLRDVLDSFLATNPKLLDVRGNETDCGLIFTPHVNGENGCYPLSYKLRRDYSDYNADIRFFSGAAPNKAGFHSGRDYDEYKRRIQDDFKRNRFPLLVATKAFGIGIDKPNIKYTIHYGIPSSREALYQEAGRAGRDRAIKEAECVVVFTPENEKISSLLREKVFAPFTTVEEIKRISKEIGHDGGDGQRQLFLLASGLVTRQEEMDGARYVLGRMRETKGSSVLVTAVDKIYFDMLQKILYHMSVVGIVSDWTVDWKLKGAKVYPNQYDRDTLIKNTREYISKYSKDEQVDVFDQDVADVDDEYYEIPIIDAFYKWYENNIIYYRRTALKDIYEDCVAFDDPEAFKNNLEAYFRLDELANALGIIADNGLRYEDWFTVLNAETIQDKKPESIIPALSRFLETYQYNVGLNYVSGILELLSTDNPQNMDRMDHALKNINKLERSEIIAIAEKTFDLFKKIGNERKKETISDLLLNGIEAEGLETMAYSILQDNYSLSIIVKKALNSIAKKLEV